MAFRVRLSAHHAPMANFAGLELKLQLLKIAWVDTIAQLELIISRNMLALLAHGLSITTILNKKVNVLHVQQANIAERAHPQKLYVPLMHIALKEVQFSQIAQKTLVGPQQVEPVLQVAQLALL